MGDETYSSTHVSDCKFLSFCHPSAQELPLQKVPHFGGKLGAALSALGCRTAGDVAQLPWATLEARFGPEAAHSVRQRVRRRAGGLCVSGSRLHVQGGQQLTYECPQSTR